MNTPYMAINRTSEDWSHVYETINMLIIAVGQIEATLSDSNQSVDTLTQSFTDLAKHTCSVSDQIQQVNDAKELDQFKSDLSSTAKAMTQNINASIQAFQFYDRVCQRLEHVSKSLEKVSSVMWDEDRIHIPASWEQIQQDIRGSYTMEAEHIMFDSIAQGGSVEEALRIYREQLKQRELSAPSSNDNENDIDLF